MKRILFYTDTPLYGGAERQMELLATHLQNDKYEVSLACSSSAGLNAICQKFIDNNKPVYRFRVYHKHDPRHFTSLYKLLKREKFDLLHLHLWNPASCRYGFFAGKLANIPIIVTEHDPFPISKIKLLLKNVFAKWTKKTIAISESNEELISKVFPNLKDAIATIKNGIDIDWWKSQKLGFIPSDRNTIRKEVFGAEVHQPVLISVGELHPRKGHQTLLEAFKLILKDLPNVKLVIVGDGPKRKSYEQFIKNNGLEKSVLLLGRRQDVPKLMFSADIFVHPSTREAFGFVILEAMVSGLPIVATRVGGVPELIEEEKTGALVEPENAEALYKAIIDLIQNPAKKKLFSENAMKRADEFFSAKRMADETAKVYDQI